MGEAAIIEFVLGHLRKDELRTMAEYYRVARSGTKAAIAQRILDHLDGDPLVLISGRGPWYRNQWNDFVERELGGRRRRSYSLIQQEISRLLRERQGKPPSHDSDLWRCTVAAVLRTGRVDELAGLVGRSRRSVLAALRGSHGNKRICNLFTAHFAQASRAVERFRMVNGRYQIVRELGAGGFGAVYEADDLRFPARGRVVLKFAIDHEDNDFLEREIVRAFDLTHRNICRYYDFDQEDRDGKAFPFLVIEYGGESLESLFDQLDPDERFSRDFAFRVVWDVAAALDYAAERHQVIHGDVNPGNILIGDDDVVRLTDFGLAARLRPERTSKGRRTMMGTSLLGMHHVYSAPEILAGRHARRSSDQYSLAMVFCAMMEGTLFDQPYRRRSFDVLTRRQNNALKRALELDPRNRFPTCELFAKALCGK